MKTRELVKTLHAALVDAVAQHHAASDDPTPREWRKALRRGREYLRNTRGRKVADINKRIAGDFDRLTVKRLNKKLPKWRSYSVRKLAARMTAKNIPTPGDVKHWHATTVHRMLKRIERLPLI